MIQTLVVIVLIVVVGVSVLAYRYRSQRGIESGITSFRRELRALAPESDDGPRAARRRADPPSTSGVGVLRPDASAGPPDERADERVDETTADTTDDRTDDGGAGSRAD